MTLSKAGLAGERVGIAFGPEDLIASIEGFQANVNLNSSRFGQAIAARAIRSGELEKAAEEHIRPFYKDRFEALRIACETHLPAEVPWRLHESQGCMFGWLLFENLPITDTDLYQKLKDVGVIAVPGSTFFPGATEMPEHAHEYIRVSIAVSDEDLNEGMKIIGEEVKKVYTQVPSVTEVTAV